MADVVESSSQSPVSVDENSSPIIPIKKPKPSKSIGVKKPAAKPTHPATSELVIRAITTLKERNGSSLQAIKKFIASEYKLDTDRLAPFIRKFLKNAVISGKLVQTKGKGASGSFKLPSNALNPSEKKNKATKLKAKPKHSDKSLKNEKKTKEKSVVSTKAATKNTIPEKKKHATSKKQSKKSSATIESVTPKQKSQKPSKVASKVKATKTKKAPSAKKAASGRNEKKTSKTTKAN